MNTDMITIREKHSRILRWCHWINFFLLSLMIWSGILIYWAHQPYITIPESLADTLNINYRLAEGMGWHFFIMWPFFINGLVYLVFLFLSGHWKELLPRKEDWSKALALTLFELKIKKTAPLSQGLYNPAQKIAYTAAFFMGVGSLLTGLAIYKPVQIGWLTQVLGGYERARFEHFIFMLSFVFFFMIHVTQVLRAGWDNFRSMVAGYSIEKK